MRSLHAGHLPQFQFHYGTIKSLEAGMNPYLQDIFQFHYGTIKRTY